MFTKKIAALAALGTIALGGTGASAALAASNGDTAPKAGTSASQGAKDQHQAAMAKALASKLGVSEATVTKALDTIHSQHQGPGEKSKAEHDKERTANDAKIAKALGVSTEKFSAAMKAALGTPGQDSKAQGGPRAQHEIDFSKVAKSLGVSETKLKAAFDANRPQRPTGEALKAGSNPFATDLAKALGMDVSKVEAALKATAPQGVPPRGERGGHGPMGGPQGGGFGGGPGGPGGDGGPQGDTPSGSSSSSSSSSAA